MGSIYSSQQRALQDQYDTRRIADFIEAGLVHPSLTAEEKGFIESRDMFFLSTVDAGGQPSVSYKGGASGFVRVANDNAIVFPCYDGNGMFLSMGNIAASAKVGLLFIDFETPHRLRVQGTATIAPGHALLAQYPEALFMVHVVPAQIFINCPRYVHTRAKAEASKYVPQQGQPTPVPGWKRIDIVQGALPTRDQDKAVAAGGLLTLDQYQQSVMLGQG